MAHNPSERHATHSPLDALAAEAARIPAMPTGPERLSAAVRLVLTAEQAGISRLTAESIIRDAFKAAQ